jgi:hypothetical protein
LHLVTPTFGTLSLIPSGRAGVVETLKVMSRLVRDGKKNLTIRLAAVSLLRECNQKNYSCEVKILHGFVRDFIRYVQDIRDVETIATPEKTLEFAAGDCDDKAVLLASMLESIGHPTRFVAIGFAPGVFVHVYVETKIGESWIPLETTEPWEAGDEPDPQIVLARINFFN